MSHNIYLRDCEAGVTLPSVIKAQADVIHTAVFEHADYETAISTASMIVAYAQRIIKLLKEEVKE